MSFGDDQKSSNPYLTGGISMLPLVDILFSSAGIFLILISIIHILQTQINIPPPTAEMAVVCSDNTPYRFFTQTDHQGIVVYSHEVERFIEERLRQRESLLPLLVAFDAEGIPRKRPIDEGLSEPSVKTVWQKGATISSSCGNHAVAVGRARRAAPNRVEMAKGCCKWPPTPMTFRG